MIAKVTPLLRLPSKVDVFDYFVPDEFTSRIKEGQLVQIPWRHEKATGVVLSLAQTQESKKFRARPVASIADENPILTSSQLDLIQKFSDYYFVARGSVARMIVPDAPEKKITTKDYALASDAEFRIAKSQLPALEQFASTLSDQASHITISDVSSFVWLIVRLSKHTQSQLLVLVPNIEMINAMQATVQILCSGKCTAIHSDLNKTQYWNAYKSIRDAKSNIIFSTRQGVFLPIQANSIIIFFESTSDDFKQYDQHPKYDARIAANWLAGISKSQLIFTSSSSIVTNKALSYINLPPARSHNLKIKIIDMEQEMTKKDFSIMADKTIGRVQETINAQKKVVILSLREKSDKGVSVEALYEILTKSLKNCNISTDKNDFDVLVATPNILEGLKLSSKRGSLGLLIFSSIEPLLAIPDYRSSERVYYRLQHWKMLAQELGFSELILQSYSPNSSIMRAFAYDEVDAFIKNELEHRKELQYPPFVNLIKLSYRRKKNNPYDDEQAARILKQELDSSVKILGPFVDKKKKLSIVLKFNSKTDLSMLKELSKDWSIDRDPENVL
tara:strand:- start:12908 stop:14587 length:1680 start_codon:yes stop_codon:yes gene_type:complete